MMLSSMVHFLLLCSLAVTFTSGLPDQDTTLKPESDKNEPVINTCSNSKVTTETHRLIHRWRFAQASDLFPDVEKTGNFTISKVASVQLLEQFGGNWTIELHSWGNYEISIHVTAEFPPVYKNFPNNMRISPELEGLAAETMYEDSVFNSMYPVDKNGSVWRGFSGLSVLENQEIQLNDTSDIELMVAIDVVHAKDAARYEAEGSDCNQLSSNVFPMHSDYNNNLWPSFCVREGLKEDECTRMFGSLKIRRHRVTYEWTIKDAATKLQGPPPSNTSKLVGTSSLWNDTQWPEWIFEVKLEHPPSPSLTEDFQQLVINIIPASMATTMFLGLSQANFALMGPKLTRILPPEDVTYDLLWGASVRTNVTAEEVREWAEVGKLLMDFKAEYGVRQSVSTTMIPTGTTASL